MIEHGEDPVMPKSGWFAYLGCKATYKPNPMFNGMIVQINGNDYLHLEGEPTLNEMVAATRGYFAGVQDGERLGRERLKNEFKRLFGLFN